MFITPAARKAHIKLGRFGENIAVELLKYKGFYILARNFRLKSGELDIVALDGLTIVFIEVKTIRQNPGFTPACNLSLKQMRRNRATGRLYLTLFGIPDNPCRFDLIEITVDRRKPRKLVNIVHNRNIFPCL